MNGSNPMFPVFKILMIRMTDLNGMLFLLESHLRNLGKLLRNKLGDEDLRQGPILAARLAFSDLTGEMASGKLLPWPTTEPFTVEGDQYLAMTKDIMRRESAWTAAQGYEAFETFLFDVVAAFLHSHPEASDAKKRGKVKASLPDTALDFWRAYARLYRGNNNKDILKLVRKLANGVADVEKRNVRNLDLRDWYRAASEMRHAATHQDFEVEPEKESAIAINHATWFACDIVGKRRVLALDRTNAQYTLEVFLEYAFLIYKSLSIEKGYKWDFFTKSSNETK